MSQGGHRPHYQGSHGAHKRWASRWSHVSPSPGPSPTAKPQANVLASQVQPAKDQAGLFLAPTILSMAPSGSGRFVKSANNLCCLAHPNPHAERPQDKQPLGKTGNCAVESVVGTRILGGGEDQEGEALSSGFSISKAWGELRLQEPMWRSETCPSMTSGGSPSSPQGLAAWSGLCTPPGGSASLLGLSAQTASIMWVFLAVFGGNFACLMTKDLFPPGVGAKPCKSSWCCR